MKQQHIESKAKSQSRQGIQNVFSGTQQAHQSTLPDLRKGPVLFIPLAGHGGSFILGKGPPGSSHSPGAGRGHPPENKADPPREESLRLNQIK